MTPCWRVETGDCIEGMAAMSEASVDAIVTDPPYGLGFMGREWDKLPPGLPWAQECLRVLKPGGHLLAFGGTRTYHRLAVAVEDAGFEIRDMVAWLYGSGFPKSLDVSKAIDKAAGAERLTVGIHDVGPDMRGDNYGRNDGARMMADITAPATPDAERWQGWGTALKPAHEPIVLARKPLTGTVAANVLEHGTGALNVDGCRIEGAKGAPASPSESRGVYGHFNGRDGEASAERRYADVGSTDFAPTPGPRGGSAEGRWPANVCLDPEAAAMLDEQTGDLHSQSPATRGNRPATSLFGGTGEHVNEGGFGDAGGASRFLYVAKASSEERNRGLDGFETQTKASGGHGNAEADPVSIALGSRRAARNVHPTVKPLELMRWLIRLVTPPGGIVLDPFTGSGTTGIAAMREGFSFIGIEREAEYVAIARARIVGDAPLLNGALEEAA